MKKTMCRSRVIIGITILAFINIACKNSSTTEPKAQYARCAGSYEPEKCNELEGAMAKEAPQLAEARAKRIEQDRQKAMQEVQAEPVPPDQPSAAIVADASAQTALQMNSRQWFVFDVNRTGCFESNTSPADRIRDLQSWGEYAKAKEGADGTVEVGHDTSNGYEYWTFFRTLTACKSSLPKSQAIPSRFE